MARYSAENPPTKTLKGGDMIVFSPHHPDICNQIESDWINTIGEYNTFPFAYNSRAEGNRFDIARKIYGYEDTVSATQFFPQYRSNDYRAATRIAWFLLAEWNAKEVLPLDQFIQAEVMAEPWIAILKTADWIENEEQRKDMVLAVSKFTGLDLRPYMEVK